MGVVNINYFLSSAIAFVVVILLVPLLKKLAFRIDFLDKPVPDKDRKIHREPIPLTASIGIFAAFFIAFALFRRKFDTEFFAVLTGSLLIMGIGFVDDWYKTRGKELKALPKMLVQLLAAFIVYESGIVFSGFHNPFTNSFVILPSWLQLILTIMWIFGVTTVINFSDGMDGLAGGLSCISAITLFAIALAKGQTDSALMAVALVGAGLGYLRFNRPPAKIFMGDAGATFMGFILAIIALDGAFKQATVLSIFVPILALGVPIFDNIFVIIKRFAKGKPIYVADSEQVHYRLLSAGLSQKQVVGVLYLANTCLCLASLVLFLLKV